MISGAPQMNSRTTEGATPAASPFVALYRPASIGGVVSAGVRLAMLTPSHRAWRPLIVGEGLDEHAIKSSPLWGCPALRFATWRAGADASMQVASVRRALREMGARVVIPNDLPHGFVAAALDHRRGVRCAAWVHADAADGDDLVLSCGELAETWRAVSERGADRVRRLGIMPTAGGVMPACVQVPDHCPPPRHPDGVLRLLYVGRLEKMHKRVPDLVPLADELQARDIAFALSIIGDGPARAELAHAAREHAAAGRIILRGPLPLARLGAEYHATDATVLVSGSEGMPLAVMESLAAGRPVAITTGCGGALDTVREGVEGWIVNTGDMAAMAAKLAGFARDPAREERAETMGRAAHRAARERLSVAALARDYDAFGREALAAPEQSFAHDPAALSRRWGAILSALQAIGPASESGIAELRADWLRSMALSVTTPLPSSPPERPTTAESLFDAAIRALRERGIDRIGLYGAGAHTRKLTRALAAHPHVLAIIDDRAGDPGMALELCGRPVLAPHETLALGLEAIVVSSDEHEREMLPRARGWFPSSDPMRDVIGLYGRGA